jgi:hypothetical protein
MGPYARGTMLPPFEQFSPTETRYDPADLTECYLEWWSGQGKDRQR